MYYIHFERVEWVSEWVREGGRVVKSRHIEAHDDTCFFSLVHSIDSKSRKLFSDFHSLYLIVWKLSLVLFFLSFYFNWQIPQSHYVLARKRYFFSIYIILLVCLLLHIIYLILLFISFTSSKQPTVFFLCRLRWTLMIFQGLADFFFN